MAGTEVERLTRQAERLQRAGRLRQAAELYRRALRRDPANPTALKELDTLSIDPTDDAVFEDPAAQVTVDEMERTAQTALGDLHAARHRWEAACECYRTAVEMDGSDPLAWAKLGRSLARAGRWRESAEALDQALLLSGVDDTPARDLVAEPSAGEEIQAPSAYVPEVSRDLEIAQTIEPDPPAPARVSVSTAGPIQVQATPSEMDLALWPVMIEEPDVLPAVSISASDPVPEDFFSMDPAADMRMPAPVQPDAARGAVVTGGMFGQIALPRVDPVVAPRPARLPEPQSPSVPPAVIEPTMVRTDSPTPVEPAAVAPLVEAPEIELSQLRANPAHPADLPIEVLPETVTPPPAAPASAVSQPAVLEVVPDVTSSAGDMVEIPFAATTNDLLSPPALTEASAVVEPVEWVEPLKPEAVVAAVVEAAAPISVVVEAAEIQLPAEASADTSAGQPAGEALVADVVEEGAVDSESDEDVEDFDEDVAEPSDAADAMERVRAAEVLGEEFNPRLLKRKRKRKERTEAVDLSRRGTIAMRQRNLVEAISCFSRLTGLLPNSAKAHRDLGAALLRADRLEEAATSLHHALQLRPKFADAYSSLADCYHLLGRLDRAVMCYRQTLALRPTAAKAHSNLLLTLNYHHKADPQLLCEEHLLWYDRHARPLESQIRPHENDPDPNRVIRVGYVSPDFRRHSVNFFFEPILLNHDRTKFHLTCYSDTARPDDITEAIAARVDGWRDIRGMGDDEVARQIHEDRIDLLVDLAGHTGGNRLLVFARKPAPVQITWMGYPNTTGLPTMDWRITDVNADPPGKTEKYHTERMARLPRSFLCYAPQPEAPEITDPPMIANGYVTFGCFNILPKITPDVMAVWAKILLAVPSSKLILKDRNGALGYPSRVQYVRDVFRYHGVTADRLEMRGKDHYFDDHLKAYADVDIMLDPFPYNGATTTCESLWMGVPVITLAGKVHAGRVGVSLLKTLGMSDFIAETTDSYIRKAAVLSANRNGLSNLRHSLRSRMLASPLTDGVRFTKDVEGLLRQMWARWCKGQTTAKQSHGDSGSILSLRE